MTGDDIRIAHAEWIRDYGGDPDPPGPDAWNPRKIDTPGVCNIPADAYHADPVAGGSLSSTGARELLPPSCPAIFAHHRDHGRPHRAVFDLGHAAHADVLGVGDPIEVIDAADWRTKAARDAATAARAAGRTPLLAADAAAAAAMGDAVRAHPVAGTLLAPGAGDPEKTLVWVDDDTGVWCRAMVDFITDIPGVGPAIVDLKTTACSEPGAVARSVHNYGYHQQDAWYSDGYAALNDGVAPVFLFVFVEKTPPHPVTVAQLDPEARDIGRERNRWAVDVYRRCVATGQWPGYTDDVVSVSLPGWARNQHNAALDSGLYDIGASA